MAKRGKVNELCAFFLSALLLPLLLPFELKASGDSTRDETPDSRMSPSYCGVYSLYAALNSIGLRPSFEALLCPEYVGSLQGSSRNELKAATIANGAYARAVDRLTIPDLLALRCPAILHFTSEGTYGTYNHWVCFLGAESRHLRILDPSETLQLMTPAEVLSRWDGSCLIVSASPLSFWSVSRASLLGFFLYVIPISAIGLWQSARLTALGSRFSFSSYRKAALVLAVAATVTCLNEILSAESLYRNDQVVHAIARSKERTQFRHLSTEEFNSLNHAGHLTVIDARSDEDFAAGHIAGAINIPTQAGRSVRSGRLKNVPTSSQLVVYCQSLNCPYSQVVSQRLHLDGYSNIAILDGGWMEWKSSNQDAK